MDKKYKGTVLLIEDDAFISGLIQRKFEQAGLDIITAEDGKVGLELMREKRPNLVLILLDLILPSMGGFEILKNMKDDSELSKIPVVVLSNLGQDIEIERAKKLGAKEYFIKAHTNLDDIVKIVQKYIK